MVEENRDYLSERAGEPQLALQEVDSYSPSIEIWPQPMSGLDTIDTHQVPLQESASVLTTVVPPYRETPQDLGIDFKSDRSFEEEMSDIIPYLLPGEKVVKLHRLPDIKSPRKLSAEEILLKLGNVDNPKELGIYPLMASGVPEGSEHIEALKLFIAQFGRDPLVSMKMIGKLYPEAAKSTVISLAEYQGKVIDLKSEEEPGKIPHEIRPEDDPIAIELRKKGWKIPYFGTIDATPFHMQVSMEIAKREPGFLKTRINNGERSMEDAVIADKNYMVRKQDMSLTGLIEHAPLNPKGIVNQNWKDSNDSLFHADGTLPAPDSPKAFLEVQVYTYDAFLDMAEYYVDKDPELAADLTERAGILREQILDKFWIEDERGGYFAPALERVKGADGKDTLIPFEIRTSNMGHTLWSRLLKGDDPEIVYKREAVLRTLHSPDMRNISGFRTLSTNEIRYKPTGYHIGTVWFWDSTWIALGEKELGYEALARQDMYDIFRAVDGSGEMPEYAKGSDSLKPEFNEREVVTKIDGEGENKVEQVGQKRMLWTTAGIIRIGEEMKSWTSDVYASPIEKECQSLMRNNIFSESEIQNLAAD